MLDVEEGLNPASRSALHWALYQLKLEMAEQLVDKLDALSDEEARVYSVELIEMIRSAASEVGFPIEYATDRDIAIVVSAMTDNILSIVLEHEGFVSRFMGGNVFLNCEEGMGELNDFVSEKLNLLGMSAAVKLFLSKFCK